MKLSLAALAGFAPAAFAQPCGDVWTPWSGEAPPYRSLYSVAFDTGRQRVILFGGLSGTEYRSDTWEWDGSGAGSWLLRASTGPAARHSPAIAYDSVRARTVLFGGRHNGGVFRDTWSWDGTAWTQFPDTPSPGARFGALMAFDVQRATLVLANGRQLNNALYSDTWEWDWNTSTWILRAALTVPQGSSVTYHLGLQRVVMMTTGISSLRAWNGASWQEVQGVSGEVRGTMVFDPRPQQLVTVEINSVSEGRTYTLLPSNSWINVSSQHPVVQELGGLVFDGTRLLALGGVQGAFSISRGDMLVRSGPAITQGPTQVSGNPLVLSTSAAGPGPLLYQWRRNGVDLEDGQGFSGTTTPQLSISPYQQGRYSVAVTDTCGTTVSRSLLVCYADCNLSNYVEPSDFICFIGRYSNADTWANCDGSTGTPLWNANDFVCFVNSYAAGCP